MEVISILLSIIIGYLFGSIPFSYIFGKFFFKKDIRKLNLEYYDTKNLSLILNKFFAIFITILNPFKSLLAMFISYLLFKKYLIAIVICGFSSCIANSFNIFLNFKGTKLLTITFGYLIGLVLFAKFDLIFTLLFPLLAYIITLSLSKYLSISFLISILFETIIMTIFTDNILYPVLMGILFILSFIKHRQNIANIIRKKEEKVTFIK